MGGRGVMLPFTGSWLWCGLLKATIFITHKPQFNIVNLPSEAEDVISCIYGNACLRLRYNDVSNRYFFRVLIFGKESGTCCLCDRFPVVPWSIQQFRLIEDDCFRVPARSWQDRAMCC